jgi:hypothetical protein
MKKYLVIYHSTKNIEHITILWSVLVMLFIHLTSRLASTFSYTLYHVFTHRQGIFLLFDLLNVYNICYFVMVVSFFVINYNITMSFPIDRCRTFYTSCFVIQKLVRF